MSARVDNSPSSLPAPTRFAERVTEATGLAGMIAAGALTRCCSRMKFDPEQLTPRSLKLILPSLRTMLAVYLDDTRVQRQMLRLKKLAEAEE